MKKYIRVDEVYPFFWLNTDPERLGKVGNEVDIPKKKVEWIEETLKEFDKVQEYLRDKHTNWND